MLALPQAERPRGPHHFLHVRSYIVWVFVSGVLVSDAAGEVGRFLVVGEGRALGMDPVEGLLRLAFVLPRDRDGYVNGQASGQKMILVTWNWRTFPSKSHQSTYLLWLSMSAGG